MNITEFRQKYPQYNDLDDKTLGDKFYSKYYSDMPRAEFDTKFLGAPVAKPTGQPTLPQRVATVVKKAMPYAQAALAGPSAQPGEGDFSPLAASIMNIAGAKPAAPLRNIPQNVPQMSPTARFGPTIGAGVNVARVAGELIRPGYDVAKYIPDKSLGYLTAGMIAPGGQGAAGAKVLNRAIDKGLAKGIRPSHAGVKDYIGMSKFIKRGREAVKAIFSNKKNLNLVDEFGEQTGKLPETLDQFAQAVQQTKRKLFQAYDAMTQVAGKAKARIALNPIAREFDKIAADRVIQRLHPEVAEWASRKSHALKKLVSLTPDQVQDEIAHANAITKAFQQNPTPQAIKTVTAEAMYANLLRKSLDSRIEQAAGPGYQALKNQYGALKTIEKDVIKRAIVDARKNTKGLIDFSDIASAAEMAKGLSMIGTKGAPGSLVSGGIMKAIAEWYKHLNSPNTAIKQMFQAFEKAPSALSSAGRALGMGATQAAAQRVGRNIQPKPETSAKIRGALDPASTASAEETLSASKRGIEHYTANNWDAAIKEWQKALKEDPQNARQIIGWINTAKEEKKKYGEFMKRQNSPNRNLTTAQIPVTQ